MADMDMEGKPEERSEAMPEETETEAAEEKTAETSGEEKPEQADAGGEEGSGAEGEEGAEEKKEPPRGRGLYRYIKISLPTLNKLIIVLCLALVICLIYGIQDRGYIVDFNSQGGTPVESEKLMYSDKVIPPEEPYREGYTFTGWYTNADCTEEWDLDTGLVGGPMTLYAGWEKKDE